MPLIKLTFSTVCHNDYVVTLVCNVSRGCILVLLQVVEGIEIEEDRIKRKVIPLQ